MLNNWAMSPFRSRMLEEILGTRIMVKSSMKKHSADKVVLSLTHTLTHTRTHTLYSQGCGHHIYYALAAAEWNVCVGVCIVAHCEITHMRI